MTPLDLLSGDSTTFLAEVWGRRTLIHTADAAALASLFSLEDADALLTTAALRTPQVRVAQDGSVVPESRYTRSATIAGKPMTGLVDARKILALFDDGATIIFQGLQRYHEPLRQLIRGLEQALGHPCQANAYLTPPGSQGFALHADTHDVFTFQTCGSKQWQIEDAADVVGAAADPAQDPAEGATARPDGAGPALRDVLMEPGIVMYLPTGTKHLARTQESVSLHVTVGINQVTWGDVMRDVLTRVLAEDAAADEHLPAGLYNDPDALAAALAQRLDGWAEAVRGVDAAAHVDRMELLFSTARQPVLSGGLLDRVTLGQHSGNTEGVPALAQVAVRRRPGSQCTVRPRGDALELLLGDRRLTVPAYLKPALDVLLTGEPATASELPLGVGNATVLVRRLVREGLLEVVR